MVAKQPVAKKHVLCLTSCATKFTVTFFANVLYFIVNEKMHSFHTDHIRSSKYGPVMI